MQIAILAGMGQEMEPKPASPPAPSARRNRRLIRALLALLVVLALSPLVYRAVHHQPGRTVTPPRHAPPGRWVVLEGANNTRDLGGYRTRDGRRLRWKTLYRSGELTGLTDAGGQAFRDLGIRRVIDFRYRTMSSPLFDGDAFSVFRWSSVSLLPVQAVSGDSTSSYVNNVRENAACYRQAFELIADPANLPLLFHCRAGRDRTGIMAALLLTLLGVDRETVLDDFLLSLEVDEQVDRPTMEALLDEVERQGGIERYLETIGVPRATQDRLRTLLLE